MCVRNVVAAVVVVAVDEYDLVNFHQCLCIFSIYVKKAYGNVDFFANSLLYCVTFPWLPSVTKTEQIESLISPLMFEHFLSIFGPK